MSKIRYAALRNLDISNGENVGVALFVQGCKFHCYNCFNAETWDFNGGEEWTQGIKEKFLQLIDKPYIKRVSLLGGEPLADENLDGVLNLVTEINNRYNSKKMESKNPRKIGIFKNENTNKRRISSANKLIWLYTGYCWEDIFSNKYTNNSLRQQIISKCDVLIDGPYIDSKRDITLKWCGSTNQRVIDIKKSLQSGEIVLWKG